MALRDRDVEIRRPCPVKLDPKRAEGGAKSWYCGHCEKSVHVLSNMTEAEARDFLGQRVGQDLCVTYAVRRDGSIRFRPEPIPPDNVVPVSALTRGRKVAAAVGLGLALAACAPHDNPDVRSNLRLADPPIVQNGTSPTIPDADVDDVMVDGKIEFDERLVDGEVAPEPMVPGGITVEPLPPEPQGGITVEALPDEPCDTLAPDPKFMKRGGIRALPREG